MFLKACSIECEELCMRTQRSQPAASQARRLQQGILQHFVQPTVNSVN
jgi:hypothetical protein